MGKKQIVVTEETPVQPESQPPVFGLAQPDLPVEDIIIWTPQEIDEMLFTSSAVREIEKTHRNLGIPTIFAKCCDMANLGMFITGPRAAGKTTIIKTLKLKLLHRSWYDCDFLTPRGLKKIQAMFNNASISVYNNDFSSLSSEYLRDKILGLYSSLIYDHSIHGESMGLSLDIKDCFCSFISTIQPSLYAKIAHLDTFESQYKDRYLRYFLLYYRPILKDQKEKVPKVPLLEVKEGGDGIPRPFPEMVIPPPSVRELVEYKRFVKALQVQTSQQRGMEYANRILQAHAYLNGRKEITSADAKFMALHIGFLNMELFLSERDAAAEALNFNANAYTIFDYITTNGTAKIPELEAHFQIKKYPHWQSNPTGQSKKVSKTHIRDDTVVLRSKRMITGVYGMNIYRVHDQWEVWYRRPVLRFLELIKA